VSGGAITNSILYCLARILGATAKGRIIEHDAAHVSNLNRYMLLLRSKGNVSKAPDLAQILGKGLHFRPLPERYDAELHKRIAPLAPTVVGWRGSHTDALGSAGGQARLASHRCNGSLVSDGVLPFGRARLRTLPSRPRRLRRRTDSDNCVRIFLGWIIVSGPSRAPRRWSDHFY
jgi:hypothetical protein